MYCSHCGKQMDDTARFCAACGAASPVAFARAPLPGQLTRSHYHRMIVGICAGLALHYGWDLSLVRVIAVLALFVSCGTAMLAYFAIDRKSTRLNSSHRCISYAVFCLKKK